MSEDKTVEEILESAQCNPDHVVFAIKDLEAYYRKKFASEQTVNIMTTAAYECGFEAGRQYAIRYDERIHT